MQDKLRGGDLRGGTSPRQSRLISNPVSPSRAAAEPLGWGDLQQVRKPAVGSPSDMACNWLTISVLGEPGGFRHRLPRELF